MGAILYQLLTNSAPYSENKTSSLEVLKRARQGPPTPILELCRGAPDELVSICDRAMAREPSRRYPDMGAFASDLRAYLEDRVVSAHASGAVAELRKWVRRNRATAATALIGFLALGALGSWSYLSIRDERNNANASAQAANANAVEADQERRKVKRLADQRRLEVLLSESETLWPALPEKIPAMQDWLDRARGLVGRLEDHLQTAAELRKSGRPLPTPRRAELEMLERRLQNFRDFRIEFQIEEQEQAIADLKQQLELERPYDFGEDEESQWWHDALLEMMQGIPALDHPGALEFSASIQGIEQRIRLVERVAAELDDADAAWEEAILAIADERQHPAYAGLSIVRQQGLVPIGPDPDTGLWEFWHVQSGEEPLREDGGTLSIFEDTGLVFVLIPAGAFTMGAQTRSAIEKQFHPDARLDEVDRFFRLPEVILEPFFLSKYEMSQAQWQRATGENPDYWAAQFPRDTGPDYPVSTVDWYRCRQVLFQLGLTLPTESQWEYACRSGRESSDPSGDSVRELARVANLRDQTFYRTFDEAGAYEPYSDGYASPAPIGSLLPNDFGLYDMIGNVSEWCLDAYGSYDTQTRSGDGLRVRGQVRTCVYRGGSAEAVARFGRSTARAHSLPTYHRRGLGVRPARALERAATAR
jgi:formylglycine-generating enzyme required for sulfatase activity